MRDLWHPVTKSRRRAVLDIDHTVPPQGWMCSPVFEGERSVPSLACLANHVSNMQMLQFQHWPRCITPIIRSLGDNNRNTKQSFKTIELKEFCAARGAAAHDSAQWCAWCWHRAFSLGRTHVEKIAGAAVNRLQTDGSQSIPNIQTCGIGWKNMKKPHAKAYYGQSGTDHWVVPILTGKKTTERIIRYNEKGRNCLGYHEGPTDPSGNPDKMM